MIFNQPVLVTQPILPQLEEYMQYMEGIWERKWLTNNGPLHEEFKSKLREYLNVDNVELFTNGHSALEIAIRALDLTGEIITTPFTFASTTHAIVNNGLTPVFCDIDPYTFNIDVEKIEKCITKETSAILAVHVFGTPCDTERIAAIAEKHHLKVIYDAAHAFGVFDNGTAIGNFGDISMFSLHATKVFHSIEGGVLTFKHPQLISKLEALKNFGLTKNGSVEYSGLNAKMNEFQAAMGLCNLNIVDEKLKQREVVFYTYLDGLRGIDGIQLLFQHPTIKHNYSYFPILLKNELQRHQLHEKLKEYNVFTRKYFYPLCSSFECYDFNPEETPIALDISKRVLCLPIYPDLDIESVQQICTIIEYELGG